MAEIKRQDDEITQSYGPMLIQAATVAYEADQIQKSEQRGFYISPDEKAKIMQQALYFSTEGARLGAVQKQLAAEKEELQRKLQSM